MSKQLIKSIAKDFKSLSSTPEKANMVVLLLHDVTGVKKKDIKKVLLHGIDVEEIYSKEQDFKVNKKPKAKKGIKTKAKKKKA